MIKPKFLYNNVLRDDTIEELTDWRDYTIADKGNQNTDYTVSADRTIDGWAFYAAATVAEQTGATLTLYYESSAGVFTQLDQVVGVWGKIRMREFSSVTVLSGRRIRITTSGIGGTLPFRQFAVGQVLEAEQGQYMDAINPDFTYGYRATNTISQNGSIIARDIKRVEKTGKLNIQYLTEAWFRANWEPLAKHAVKYPFFYQPNPRDYPNEVAFASASKMSVPKRSGLESRLDVSWDLKVLTSEENLVT